MTGRPQHAVTLVSIEDDARDEQLRVVWELERGAVAHDQHVLPDPAAGFILRPLVDRLDETADELPFLYIAAKKTETIREDLGSAGDVIAAQVELKMLGQRADWQTADVEIDRRTKINRDLARP
jgi:hypothetical protein